MPSIEEPNVIRKKHAETLHRRDAILEAVSFAATRFLSATTWTNDIQIVLQHLGMAAGVSRVYIFDNHTSSDGQILISQRYEWAAPGVAPQIDNPQFQQFSYADIGLARWETLLNQGEPVYDHTRNFPEEEQPVLHLQDIFSIVVVPIFVGRIWWGVLGFDKCGVEHDWSPIEIDALKAAVGILGAAILREQAEEALRSSEATNRALIDAIPDAMFQVSLDGYYLDCNIPRDANTVMNPSLLIGKHIMEVLPSGIAQQMLQANEQAFQTGKMQVIEYQLLIGETSTDYESRVVVSSQDTLLIIVRDITERKKIERMKNEFVSTVSHELRTPLTSIRGSLGLLIGGVAGELPENVRKMVDIAYKNSERLVRLINDILDIEKIESGKMVFNIEPVELMPLIEQTIDTNRAYGEQFGVTFLLQDTAPGVTIDADSDRLMQVITNLLSNAAKFSPRGESVIVSVIPHDTMVRVSITDCGPGIPIEFHDRIFQKFAQADSSDTRKVEGTGLGLSISKAIIEKLGGIISFTTEVSQGTTFYFELPARHPSITSPAQQAYIAQEQRLLICEPKQNVAAFLQKTLSEGGYLIDVASSAATAKVFLAHRDYAAMLLNIGLPDQDGITFIRLVRSHDHTRHLLIIALSSRDQLADTPEIETLGIAARIDDPFDQQKLVETLQQAIRRHPEQQKARILHVENDVDVVQFVAMMLQNTADIIQANSVQEAKHWLSHSTFDLVLLDIHLPGDSGFEVLNYLESHTTFHVPVIIFSAQEIDPRHAHHAAAILVKSRTSNEKLLRTIKSFMESSVIPFIDPFSPDKHKGGVQ